MLASTNPIILVAGGPSILNQDLGALSGTIMTINDSYKKFNDIATFCYAGDYQWWQHHHATVKGCTLAQCWTGDRQAAEQFSLHHIECRLGVIGLGRNWIVHGGNSGYQAINLAHIWGYSPIILLGFDCNYAPDGKRHHYDDHPKKFASNAEQVKSWLGHYFHMARALKNTNTRVINCSPTSALTCFEKGNINDWM